MNEPLAPGTPCYWTNLIEMVEFNGRVNDVVAGPLPDETGQWYSIDADWLHTAFPRAQVRSPRHHLQPIVPPQLFTTLGPTRRAKSGGRAFHSPGCANSMVVASRNVT